MPRPSGAAQAALPRLSRDPASGLAGVNRVTRAMAVAALVVAGLVGCRGSETETQAASLDPKADSATASATPASGSGSVPVQAAESTTPTETIEQTSPPPADAPAAGGEASATSGSNEPAVPELYQMPVNTSAMVTLELDMGTPLPTVAQAIANIERRHQPDDKTGRTFSVLDVVGEPTADGKKLRLQMHLSSEKPGLGALVDRRNGRILWHAAIIPAEGIQGVPKSLTILIEDGLGKTSMVDGSKAPARILDATLRESGKSVRDFWGDGDEREVSFIYSACGCPVKVLVRRKGDTTVRTSDRPLMFPDDPAVMQLIRRLMGWGV